MIVHNTEGRISGRVTATLAGRTQKLAKSEHTKG